MQKTDNELIEEYLLNQDKQETEDTIEFALAYLKMEATIKEIKDAFKETKKSFRDKGVAVTKVTKVLNQMKRIMKTKDMDLMEMEQMDRIFRNNVDIQTKLMELVREQN